MPSRHPPIAQRKQRRQLRRVLGQSLVAKLGEAELELAVGDWGGDLKRALEKSTGAFPINLAADEVRHNIDG